MSIVNKIESISNHLENAYNSLENIGVDLTNVNKNIENLSTQIESVYSNLPKVVDGNTEITLSPTKKGKMELTLKGNIFQNNYIGKNIFNSTLTYGKAWNNANGTETIWDNKYARTEEFLEITPSTTYTISFISKKNSPNGNILYYNENQEFLESITIENYPTFITNSSAKYIRFNFYASGGYEDGDIYNIQVEKNSSATSYEPYTGGESSPSPNYPQNVQIVTGDNIISISNEDGSNFQEFPINLGTENLWKDIPTAERYGVTFTNNGDGSYTINGTATQNSSFWVSVDYPAGTYAWSANNEQTIGSSNYLLIEVASGGTGRQTLTLTHINERKIITTTTRLTALVFVVLSGTTFNNFTIKPQLEKGNQYNSFSKYGVVPIELCKINDSQEYIYEENNNWYKTNLIGKKVFTGSNTESWTAVENHGMKEYYINIPDGMNQSNSFVYCNIGTHATIVWGQNQHACYISSTNNLNYRCDIFDSLADYKNFLTNTNMICYYILKNSSSTLITNTTLINQLNNIKKAMSYNNQTNISQTNSNLPFIINASALKKND